MLCGEVQHPLHHLLRVVGLLQEQLHGSSQQLQLHHCCLLPKGLQERLQKLVGVVDAVCVLPDDPHHTRLGLGLVQVLQVLAQGADHRLVAVGVLSEDVLDHHHRLLHHIGHLGLDQIQQHVDAALRCLAQLYRTAADGPHRASHELHVHLCGVLLELQQHLLHIALSSKTDNDLQLLHLHVDWVVVLAEEDLDLVLQDAGLLQHHQVDVAQSYVLDLGLGVEQGYQGWGELLRDVSHDFLVGDVVHVSQYDLDGGHHHCRVVVLQARHHALDDALRLSRVLGLVGRQRVQDEHLPPLSALVQRSQQLLQHISRHKHHILAARLGDL
mmetsp:Transcript_25595/g.55373  ORF Transcript_25595/g.55373 Transcript_25595/m.55373 type:complete len:327 (+) Transcript_25595:1175-2155(+)